MEGWDAGVHERSFRLATTIFVLLTAVVCGVSLAAIFGKDRGVPLFLGATVLLAALAALQMFHARVVMAARKRPRRSWTLVAQALLTYPPFLVFGPAWTVVPALLSASILLLMASRCSWAVLALVAAGEIAVTSAVGMSAVHSLYAAGAVSLIGLVGYGVLRIAADARASSELWADARARAAVVRERLRIERDLHDLVGHSLSSVVLKGELASRLAGIDPARAQAELAEVVAVARRTLADVRAVAHGHRTLSLAVESASAQVLLHDAGIDCRLTMSSGSSALTVTDVLARVLREAVTNVVRHSNARTCRIEGLEQDGWIRLAVANDGAPPTTAYNTSGTGIAGLRERVRSVGGRLTVLRRSDGWFELVAEVPKEPCGWRRKM